MIITEQGFAIIDRDTHIGKWIKETKRLDFDQSALRTYMPFFLEGGVVVNIGANVGAYAYAFIDKASSVICFEPSLELFECLRYNIGKYPNVVLYNEALSDTQEPYQTVCLNDNLGMTHIQTCDTSTNFTKTIDSYNFDRVDFLLIDCEGYEPKVLLGANKTIQKYRPIMVIEINTHTLEKYYQFNKEMIYTFLEQHNYSYRNIYENQPLTNEQFDIICFPNHE